MSTTEILDRISRLPPEEKLFIIEKTFRELLSTNAMRQMAAAAEALENEYRTNKELTGFSSIDFEDFYEAK